jgi:hypothetical protein
MGHGISRHFSYGGLCWVGHLLIGATDSTLVEVPTGTEGIWYWNRRAQEGGKMMFFTDCKVLVHAVVTGEPDQFPSWRALEHVAEIRWMIEMMEGRTDYRSNMRISIGTIIFLTGSIIIYVILNFRRLLHHDISIYIYINTFRVQSNSKIEKSTKIILFNYVKGF